MIPMAPIKHAAPKVRRLRARRLRMSAISGQDQSRTEGQDHTFTVRD